MHIFSGLKSNDTIEIDGHKTADLRFNSVSEFGVVAFAEVVFEHTAHTVEQTDGEKFGDDKVVDVHAETFLRHF